MFNVEKILIRKESNNSSFVILIFEILKFGMSFYIRSFQMLTPTLELKISMEKVPVSKIVRKIFSPIYN